MKLSKEISSLIVAIKQSVMAHSPNPGSGKEERQVDLKKLKVVAVNTVLK